MGILGIENRTENWKTTFNFAPFLGADGSPYRARLANHLAQRSDIPPTDVWIELFW